MYLTTILTLAVQIYFICFVFIFNCYKFPRFNYKFYAPLQYKAFAQKYNASELHLLWDFNMQFFCFYFEIEVRGQHKAALCFLYCIFILDINFPKNQKNVESDNLFHKPR